MEFGKSLRHARESKGLTVAQMTEMTHLAPTTINELESEDFSRIAAPIYGRGFVKLYCEAVGLDPKPFIAEFMELMSGNRDTGIKERPVESAPLKSPAEQQVKEPEFPAEQAIAPQHPDEIPPIRLPSLGQQPDLFGDDLSPSSQTVAKARHTPLASASLPPESASPLPPPQNEAPTDDHAFSRYSEPLRQLKPIISTPLWRIGVLAGGAILLLVLFVLGIRAVYRATQAEPVTDKTESTHVDGPAKSSPPPAASVLPKNQTATKDQSSTRRTPQKIPDLYID